MPDRIPRRPNYAPQDHCRCCSAKFTETERAAGAALIAAAVINGESFKVLCAEQQARAELDHAPHATRSHKIRQTKRVKAADARNIVDNRHEWETRRAAPFGILSAGDGQFEDLDAIAAAVTEVRRHLPHRTVSGFLDACLPGARVRVEQRYGYGDPRPFVRVGSITRQELFQGAGRRNIRVQFLADGADLFNEGCFVWAEGSPADGGATVEHGTLFLRDADPFTGEVKCITAVTILAFAACATCGATVEDAWVDQGECPRCADVTWTSKREGWELLGILHGWRLGNDHGIDYSDPWYRAEVARRYPDRLAEAERDYDDYLDAATYPVELRDPESPAAGGQQAIVDAERGVTVQTFGSEYPLAA